MQQSLICNSMFSYLLQNNFISENQSFFKLSDSCVNQLLAIAREIYSSYDNKYEVRAIFLHISKAFWQSME